MENHIFLDEIESVEYVGSLDAWDLSLPDPIHHFYANGILVSNSHSNCYSLNSFRQLYQKYYFTIEFYTSLLNNEPVEKVPEIVANMSGFEARKCDPVTKEITETYTIKMNSPHIKNMNFDFEVSEDGKHINYGLGKLKYITADKFEVVKNLTEEDLQDIKKIITKKYENTTRAGNVRNTRVLNKSVFQALVYSGCFEGYESEEGVPYEKNDIIQMYNEEYKLKNDKAVKSIADKKEAQQLEEYYAGISPSKIEEDLEFIKFCRTKTHQDLEIAMSPDSPDIPQIIDYCEIVEKTKRKTKGKKKPFLILKVKKMGKTFSPIFVWEPKFFNAIFKNEAVIIELRRKETFVQLYNLSYIDSEIREKSDEEIEKYVQSQLDALEEKETKKRARSQKRAELESTIVANKKKQLKLKGDLDE